MLIAASPPSTTTWPCRATASTAAAIAAAERAAVAEIRSKVARAATGAAATLIAENHNAEAEQFRRRSLLGFLGITLAMLGLAGGYFRLQVLQHEEYQTRSEANRIKPRPIVPARGLIYDRHGRLLADNVPVLIAHFAAADLRCIFANRAYASTWGWDVDSIVGRTVAEVIGAEAYREIEPHIRRVVQGETVTYERTLPAGDGSAKALGRIGAGVSQQVATVAEPLKLQGYQLADELSRAFAGAAPSGFQAQPILVTTELLRLTGTRGVDASLGFEAAYGAIWSGK